jgi:hypothetical protein
LATEFKEKSFDLKARGEAAILLASPAGKKVTVTVRSKEKTDINLFIAAPFVWGGRDSSNTTPGRS